MPGMVVFKTVDEALNAGYHIYDRTPTGYLMRIKTSAGWALAIVDLT